MAVCCLYLFMIFIILLGDNFKSAQAASATTTTSTLRRLMSTSARTHRSESRPLSESSTLLDPDQSAASSTAELENDGYVTPYMDPEATTYINLNAINSNEQPHMFSKYISSPGKLLIQILILARIITKLISLLHCTSIFVM